MESCFQLLSLFYLTIGRNNEAPAAFSLTSTIKRLLDHLTEVDLYSAKDLKSLSATIERLSKTIRQEKKGGGSDIQHSPYLLELVTKRLELCEQMADALQKRLGRFGECLLDKHEKIISILRSISLANTKANVSWPVRPTPPETRADPLLPVLGLRSQEAAETACRSWRAAYRWKILQQGWINPPWLR